MYAFSPHLVANYGILVFHFIYLSGAMSLLDVNIKLYGIYRFLIPLSTLTSYLISPPYTIMYNLTADDLFYEVSPTIQNVNNNLSNDAC